tara:strand:+ start:6677 stop:6892 length:216 start_codon:yes stop_codon:yes gene_type:complete
MEMENRQMTFDEIFYSRIKFYKEDRSDYSFSNQVFLNSIMNTEKKTLTKKQKQAFVNTVDAFLHVKYFSKK